MQSTRIYSLQILQMLRLLKQTIRFLFLLFFYNTFYIYNGYNVVFNLFILRSRQLSWLEQRKILVSELCRNCFIVNYVYLIKINNNYAIRNLAILKSQFLSYYSFLGCCPSLYPVSRIPYLMFVLSQYRKKVKPFLCLYFFVIATPFKKRKRQ